MQTAGSMVAEMCHLRNGHGLSGRSGEKEKGGRRGPREKVCMAVYR